MHTPPTVVAPSTEISSVYFVDATLPDLHTLLGGLPAGAQVQLLPAQSDGLKFMADALLGRSGINALHLICHGAPGRLFLGSVAVGIDSLPQYASELYAISDAMAEDGQWLIYGCEVAQGVEGRRFVEGLRLITGLQVAAATHKVGAAALGGSWELDDAPLGAMPMKSVQVAAWVHVLAITSFSLELGGANTSAWNRPDPYTGSQPVVGAQEGLQWGTFTSVAAGDGTLFNYAFVKFTPSQTGTFNFQVQNTSISDSMMFLYRAPTLVQSPNGDFLDGSSNPLGTFVIGDDDSGDTYFDTAYSIGTGGTTAADDFLPGLKGVTLTGGQEYYLVISSYTAADAGKINFNVNGPVALSVAGTLAAPIVVTSNLDTVDANDGVVTLREALTLATAGDTVTFDSTVTGTITLLSNLNVGDGVTIDFSGVVNTLTIADDNSAGNSLVFGTNSATLKVGTGDTVTLAAPLTSTTGAITKIGDGTLHLSAYGNGTGNSPLTGLGLDSGSFKGRVYINEGDITYLDRGMPDRVTLNGGQITHSNNNVYTGTITVGANGGTVFISSGLGFNPTVTGTGTLTVEAAGSVFGPSITTFTGDLIIESGRFAPRALDSNGLELIVDSAIVAQPITAGNIDVQTGAIVRFNNGPGITVAEGKTLTGGGTIFGNVTVASGGTIDAGTTSTAGALTINGDLNIQSGGTLAGQIGGTMAGAGYDQIVVSGNVTLGATSAITPTVIGSFSPGTGQTFQLVAKDSSGPIAGTFSGAAEGGSLGAGSSNLSISYTGNDGNDLVLTGPDTTAPTLISSSPADNDTGVSHSSAIVLTFSEPVTAVSGKNLVIYKSSDNSVVSTIDATDFTQVAVYSYNSTSLVVVAPTTALDYNTEYYLRVDAGAFKDLNNNDYAGISSTSALSFTTQVAPTLTTIATLSGGTANAANVVSFDQLAAAGNEADSGGTVVAFVVKAVTTGTLTIGGNPWAAGSNDTIDSNNAASWTPATNAVGSALDAFTVVAKDNSFGESATPIQVKLEVNAAPTLDATKSPAFNAALGAAAPVNGVTTGSVLVSALINSDSTGLNNYADLNDAAPGLAVTGVNGGTLWYSTNAGANWTALTGTVSLSSALVLHANAVTRVYYQPDINATAGTINDALTIHAWDHRGNVANGTTGVALGSSGGVAIYSATSGGGNAFMLELIGNGNYAFATDDINDSLIVFNVADPANITWVKTVALPDRVRDIKADGTHVYVANDNDGGLKIYAISDLTGTAPTVSPVGEYVDAGDERVLSVEVDGQVAYVGVRDVGLVKLNIANLAAPAVLDTNEGTPGTYDRYVDLAKVGNYIYAYDSDNGDIKVFNAANFTAAPTAVDLPSSNLEIDGLIQVDGKVWAWGFNGVTNGVFGFSVNSSTGVLTQTTLIDTGNASPKGISFNSTTAYVATNSGTLRFDTSATPASTSGGINAFDTPTGNYASPFNTGSVLATNNGVYAGGFDLASIDFDAVQISNPFSTVSDTVAVTLTGGGTDITAPAFVSASVNGTALALTYDEALAGTVPLATAFTVKVNGSVVNSAISAVAIDGPNPAKLNLTLANALRFGDNITISYTDAIGNDVAAIQDGVGNDAMSLVDYGVTNATAATSTVNIASQVVGKSVALAVGGGFSISAPTNAIAPTTLGKNIKMPLGQFAFNITGVSNGGTASLSMTADSDLKQLTYYKWNYVTNKWTNIATGVENNTSTGKSTIKFSLTDGGAYDADRTANGTIVDPGGLAENTLLPVLFENTTSVGDVTLLDTNQVNGTLSYAITGGSDAAKFSINTSTGALTFLSAPNFEAPTDLGYTAGDNTYGVDVRVSGSNGGSELQSLIVTVLNVPEAGDPTVGSNVTATEEAVVLTPPPAPEPAPAPAPAPEPAPAPADSDSDSDSDGVSAQEEAAVPNFSGTNAIPVAGDGNGDGVSDAQQAAVSSARFRETPNITSNPNAPATFVTLVADSTDGKANGSTASITEIKQLDVPADFPISISAPLGLISFKANIAEVGSRENFSLYVDPDLGVNGYWKQASDGVWVNLASTVYGGRMLQEGGKLRLDFVIEDGGVFDADGRADGTITDPGAIGSMPLSITDHQPVVANDGFWF